MSFYGLNTKEGVLLMKFFYFLELNKFSWVFYVFDLGSNRIDPKVGGNIFSLLNGLNTSPQGKDARHTTKWQLLKRSYDFGACDSRVIRKTRFSYFVNLYSSEVNGEMLERITAVIDSILTSLAEYFDRYFTSEDTEAFDWIRNPTFSVCILWINRSCTRQISGAV